MGFAMRNRLEQDDPDVQAAGRRRRCSRHAAKRSAQRAIPNDAIKVICAFGEREHDNHGGIRYLMSRDAMDRVYRLLGHTQLIERLSGCYVVVASNDPSFVITVGHRNP
jgi:hypothetical protein